MPVASSAAPIRSANRIGWVGVVLRCGLGGDSVAAAQHAHGAPVGERADQLVRLRLQTDDGNPDASFQLVRVGECLTRKPAEEPPR